MSIEGRKKCLTIESLNSSVKNVQYAVRGRIFIRASELENEIKKVNFFYFCDSIE